MCIFPKYLCIDNATAEKHLPDQSARKAMVGLLDDVVRDDFLISKNTTVGASSNCYRKNFEPQVEARLGNAIELDLRGFSGSLSFSEK